MKISSRKELYNYLNNQDLNFKKETEISSVYFLIKYNEITEPIYFYEFKNSYFECPCDLHKFNMKEKEIENYVQDIYEPEYIKSALEFEKTMQRGEWHYDIDTPQCMPFLPEKIEILKIFSESECLDWLIENQINK